MRLLTANYMQRHHCCWTIWWTARIIAIITFFRRFNDQRADLKFKQNHKIAMNISNFQLIQISPLTVFCLSINVSTSAAETGEFMPSKLPVKPLPDALLPPSLPPLRIVYIRYPSLLSGRICCVSWYQMMYDGGSIAPRTTHRSTTVLPDLT